MESVDIMGVRFHNVTMDEALQAVLGFMRADSGEVTRRVVTPNPEIVRICLSDSDAMDAISGAELVVADGIGVIYAARILGTPLKAKVPGFDLASALLPHLQKGGYRLFLLGAAPGVAQDARERLIAAYPGLDVCGTCDGYFTDESDVIRQINQSRADICFVCLGAPKQEIFMRNHAADTCAKVMMGLGGSLDVMAGRVARAPEIFRRTGFEWLYRGVTQPGRWRRMLKLPLFLVDVARVKYTRG